MSIDSEFSDSTTCAGDRLPPAAAVAVSVVSGCDFSSASLEEARRSRSATQPRASPFLPRGFGVGAGAGGGDVAATRGSAATAPVGRPKGSDGGGAATCLVAGSGRGIGCTVGPVAAGIGG